MKCRYRPEAYTTSGTTVVWCPRYRRPVLTGPVATRCGELIRAKCDERGWQVVIALEVMPNRGAVSAATVRRYIDTQYERPWRKGQPS
ncbi:transposase [Micromonosporaceae bacterium B7E4]